MFASRLSAVAAATAVVLAVATAAQAGGYAGNGCVSKKQAALGKYASSVGKAWDKFPSDTASRNTAIADAFTKLDGAWTKNEAKAISKQTSCSESTSTSTAASDSVNSTVTGLGTAADRDAVTSYIAAVMKAEGKYIKDPTKDPGKATLSTALDAAGTDKLGSASPGAVTAANQLQADLVEDTTDAPDYPTTFQGISPAVCTANLCGGSQNACTQNSDCETVTYGKDELTPKCVDGDPYMYFAKKGTSNNVVMYYQGGGACWSYDSCFNIQTIPGQGSICKRTVSAGDNPDLSTTGFANYDNPANPFHDWSVVFISYCTCDVHWGDNQQNYGGSPPHIAFHFGHQNSQVVEKWAREHFLDPDRVFVTGSSAGSYGALMNSYYLMKNVWPNSDFSVLGDAGVGVITKQFLASYIDHWGVDKHFPTDLPGVAPPASNLSLVQLIDGLASKYQGARFANYDSSYDGGSGSQSQFFQVMRHDPTPAGGLLNAAPKWANFWESTCDWNQCATEFKAANSTRAVSHGGNYHFFTGAGSRHTIFGSDKVYTETKSTRSTDHMPVTFVDWVNSMIADDSNWVDTDCKNSGGDCSLTDSCQGGTNAGLHCSKKCSGGTNDTGDCLNTSECPGGGTCNTSNVDCPGGSCQLDADTTNAPFADNNTVTCAPESCPCGSANGRCFDGSDAGSVCTSNADCTNGACSWVNCPAP
ncbi:MAG TPA: pectin acetylesterase-family hydrolase [Candidatus Binatia bacterium]